MPPSSPPSSGPDWDARNFVVAVVGVVVAVVAIVVPMVMSHPDPGSSGGNDTGSAVPTALTVALDPTDDPTTVLPTNSDDGPPPSIRVTTRHDRQPPPESTDGDEVAPQQVMALVGSWRGGGNPSGDQYYESLEVTFTADGEYSLTRAGLTPDTGYYEADDTSVSFRPTNGLSPYVMGWEVGRFGGRPVLKLLQRPGYVSTLDRVG